MLILCLAVHLECCVLVMKQIILVTGATGLLGSKLVVDLIRKGIKVRAMSRFKTPKMELIQFHHGGVMPDVDAVEWIVGDVTNPVDVMEAVNGVDYVFHCAGNVSFVPKDRESMQLINVNGTANIVNACLAHLVAGMCHVSSISALGRSSSGNYDESSEWIDSEYNSQYAISKHDAEMEVWRGIEEGLRAVIVNPGIIIGPGDWMNDSSAIFSKVSSGLRFFTEGVNGFVSVDDVTRAMIYLMEKRIHAERFVLVGDNIRFKEVMEIISDELGVAKPDIAAGPWLSAFAWRVEMIRSWMTGSRPLITRETARSAQSISRYSNNKIMEFFSGSMNDPRPFIRQTAQVFKKGKSGS